MEETIEKHIDEPIKKVVVGLNLLGITTTMSCCGYTYENEVVPKKHLNKAYVYVDMSKVDSPGGLNLLRLSLSSGWILSPLNGCGIFDFYCKGWDTNHPWNDPQCPHFYETFLLGINQLEKQIDNMQDRFSYIVTIYDGNTKYQDEYKIKHWKYKPAAPWAVTPETYKNL